MKYLWVNIPVISLLLAACSAESIDITPGENEIVFSSGIVTTRAAIDSDENDIPQQAMNNIQLIRGTDGSSRQGFATAGVASSASIAAGSGYMDLATPQYFNDFTSNAHFFAFYPEPDSYGSGKASWAIDGTQDIMITAPVTAPNTKGGVTVGFEFTHCLAQVCLKLVAADQPSVDSYGKLLSATIQVPSELELAIADNGVATLGKKSGSAKANLNFGGMDLKVAGVTSKQGLLVYPDATDLTAITLEFEKRSATTFPIENLVLTPGYKTLIVATVKGQAINFNIITLQDWNPVTETEGQDDEIGLGDPGESLKKE